MSESISIYDIDRHVYHTIADDFLFSNLTGNYYILINNSRLPFGTEMIVMQLNENTLQRFQFPKGSRIEAFLEGNNPFLHRQMKFYQ